MRNGGPSVVKAPPSRAARLSRRSWWRLRLLRHLRRPPAQFPGGRSRLRSECGGARRTWQRRHDADEGAACGEGCDVISVPAGVRVLVATKPVDFRRGADSLAALAKEELQRDPFSGTIFVFRSKRADRLKILAWDGSGLILYWKRLEEGAFRWPPISDGVMRLSASQLAALVDGLDWSRLQARDTPTPEAAS